MKILMAEDDPVSRAVLRKMVARWGYEVVACCDGTSAWRNLLDDPGIELALLDWMMPGMDGVDLCRRIRAELGERYVYVILLTGRTGVEDLVEAMNAGADDFVSKSLDSRELQVRMRAGQRIVELKQALRRQATRDGMTGLWNSTALHELLEREYQQAVRQNALLGVIMCDLDHFKQVNDTYGHRAGDCVLREAARRMQDQLRGYDALGRYGGEEFLLVLAGPSAAQAAMLAERLRQAVCQEPVCFEGASIPVTSSFGLAVQPACKLVGPEELVQLADAALYQAKHDGRNCVRICPRSIDCLASPDAAPAQPSGAGANRAHNAASNSPGSP